MNLCYKVSILPLSPLNITRALLTGPLTKNYNDILLRESPASIFEKYFESSWRRLRDIIGNGLDFIIPRPKWAGRKRTWQPNKWKWYHRHGYWATRKKNLSFDTYRPYRYHEVKGYGPQKKKWWQNTHYYRPLSSSIKFW